MNPRAQAANNFTRGIKGQDIATFNSVAPATAHDKKSYYMGNIWFITVIAFFGYLSFFSNATKVLEN